MIFNHYPENSLSDAQQQLLLDLEKLTLSLNEGGDNNVNLEDLHSNYVQKVIIEASTPLLTTDYLANLNDVLKRYHEIVSNLHDEASEQGNDKKQQAQDNHDEWDRQEDGQYSINNEYLNTITEIEELMKTIKNGSIKKTIAPGTDLLLGLYTPNDKTIHLYLNNIIHYANSISKDSDHILAYVFIHEMFHAFYDKKAGLIGKHYIREIEEPMAECGMLNYLKNASLTANRHDFEQIYNEARENVKSKQTGLLAAYGFGLYLHDSESSPFHETNVNQILDEYSKKSNLIDHDSYNVIKYSLILLKGYPNKSRIDNEGERALYSLLIELILNVGNNQQLSFKKLYEQTKSELKEALLEKWQPKGVVFDSSYQGQLDEIIDKTISDNILVENMSPWQSAKPICYSGYDYSKIINPNLLSFLPYEHQVKCWKKLLESSTPYKSMVVTTGTGSGKTESFMMPLITDLATPSTIEEGVKAIFLYPLNALMEDQKIKLNDYLDKSGKKLTFAVYNGSSPWWDDVDTSNNTDERLSHELVYREEIQGKKKWDDTNKVLINGGRVPDIILTNPTMLEYMLLRKADEALISTSQKKLSWIVIDETHTYNGAGADELAMLIRRVLKAFDKEPDDIHFATSSATVGNSHKDLLKFISGITGQDPRKIGVIQGHRSIPDFSLATIEDGSKPKLLNLLASNDFVNIADLIPYKNNVIDRLIELDRLCNGGLKAKVHFYIEALTNGLYANLEDIKSKTSKFVLTPEIPLDNTTFKPDSRYVAIGYCTCCGKILANCLYYNGTYSRIQHHGMSYSQYVAIYDNGTTPDTNATTCDIDINNKLNKTMGDGNALISSSCPCCGAGANKIRFFNVSSSECSRAINPALLDNAAAHEDPGCPYHGKQLISFADSRKGAAKPSLEQNLETEEYWVIKTILEKLKTFDHESIIKKLQSLRNEAEERDDNENEVDRLTQEIRDLKAAVKNNDITKIGQIASRNNIKRKELLWEDALDLLYKNCETLAACFAKQEDWDANAGSLKQDYLKKYVLGALYNTMKRRSKDGFSAESYGIFTTFYPKLDQLNQLPQSVNELNNILNSLGKQQIGIKDWRDYLKIYLDYHVRSNENLFFKGTRTDWDKLDIEDCRNLKTTNGKRRSIKNPIETKGVHFKLLWRLFDCSNEEDLINKYPKYTDLSDKIIKVVEDMRKDLENLKLIVIGQQYYCEYNSTIADWHDDKITDHEKYKEKRINLRLNVADIGFCLYDEVFIEKEAKSILDTTFMGLSPYPEDYKSQADQLITTNIRNWNPPYPANSTIDLKDYYERKGVPFLMCQTVRKLYSETSIFIQYEHTAQVHRDMTNKRIKDFKDHKINVLACSTTMEMGVDIGQLEIVTMSNVPPHPANYKQRAGRAGRKFQNKSVCVTICNSDAVGYSVMRNPKESLLERDIITPTANLNSPQVVQRHINSYLLREFLKWKVVPGHALANRNIKNYALLDFFVGRDYDFYPDRTTKTRYRNLSKFDATTNSRVQVYPNNYDSSIHDSSLYKEFQDWLLDILDSTTYADIWTNLDLLKKGTILSTTNNYDSITATLNAIDDLFSYLSNELEKIHTIAVDPSLSLDWSKLKGYTGRLNFDFVSILKENLLEYCSTHQFTPNANMPVNVVELKIHQRQGAYDNPSRDLVVALNEYTPGKNVVIDGKNYTIGGVDWDRSRSFTHVHICQDCRYTWEGNNNYSQCPSCHGSNLKDYNMIEPTSFLPEEETDRITDDILYYNGFKAQLIGSDGLHLKSLTHLCDYDSEVPDTKTRILYYNDGIGEGYCICNENDCGRAKIEIENGKKNTPTLDYLRDLMYSPMEITDRKTNKKKTVYVHQNLQDYERLDYFNPKNAKNDLFRKLLIGGTILTNFSILKPYRKDKNRKNAFKANEEDESILTTLGVLACEELSNYIPCQRQDIDFLITSFKNGEQALCIYDTAKGGAGYSSQLDSNTWIIILDKCHKRLDDIINGGKGIGLDSIFSRSTMRYFEKVDIKATNDWLESEQQARNTVPAIIGSVFPTAVPSSLNAIRQDIQTATDATVFIKQNHKTWNYELDSATVPSWKQTRNFLKLNNSRRIELAFLDNPGIIPAEVSDTIKHSEDWASFAIAKNVPNGIYPLAYINGMLYVTDNEETADFNGLWGSGEIFAVKTDKPDVDSFKPTTSSFSEFYIKAGTSLSSSKDLLDHIIQLNTSGEIIKFINGAQRHKLEIKYMDEHLKNELGMIMAIQFIQALIKKTASPDVEVTFENEEYYDAYGKPYQDKYRKRITDSYQTEQDCRSMLNDLLSTVNWNKKVIKSEKPRALPHWRSFTIYDKNNNSVLSIKPHGGIANGWYINNNTPGLFFDSDTTDINSDIPLHSEYSNDILYTVSIK